MLEIKSNRHWRHFLYRYEVPEKVLAREFDWTNSEDDVDGFFRYRGGWYHLSEIERAPDFLAPWQGYKAEGFSWGIVLTISDDGESYQIGRYYS